MPLDPYDYHSPDTCGPAPTQVHEKMREALTACGVPHPCCVTSFSIGMERDEDTGEQIGPTDLVVFYGHRHISITPEQEFHLVHTLADAGLPGTRLDGSKEI